MNGLTVPHYLAHFARKLPKMTWFRGAVLLSLCGGASHGVEINWALLQQVAFDRYGAAGETSVHAWQSLKEGIAGESLDVQLTKVNDFFNQRVRWISDPELFGEEDHWSTPLETLALGAGDCEDFSIAKYVTLTSLGVPVDHLRLIYVIAETPGLAPRAHMVLAWYSEPSAVPLILDNMNPALLSASERPDLKPIFSFNHSDLWVGVRTSSSGRNPQARMARWQQVLRKTQEEGIKIDQ